jgi:hypothetical protein
MKDNTQYSSNQQKMPHHPSYPSTPGEELLGQRARDEGYKSFVMLQLLQVTCIATDHQVQLQSSLPDPTDTYSDRFPAFIQHLEMLQSNLSKLDPAVNDPSPPCCDGTTAAKGAGLIQEFILSSDGSFFHILSIYSCLLDLPLFPPDGWYTLDLKSICLQNCINLAHNNVHVTDKY